MRRAPSQASSYCPRRAELPRTMPSQRGRLGRRRGRCKRPPAGCRLHGKRSGAGRSACVGAGGRTRVERPTKGRGWTLAPRATVRPSRQPARRARFMPRRAGAPRRAARDVCIRARAGVGGTHLVTARIRGGVRNGYSHVDMGPPRAVRVSRPRFWTDRVAGFVGGRQTVRDYDRVRGLSARARDGASGPDRDGRGCAERPWSGRARGWWGGDREDLAAARYARPRQPAVLCRAL